MQRVHDMFGLLSRPSEVEKTGVVDIVFCIHQLPHHQTSAQKTFDMTCVILYILVMLLALSCNGFIGVPLRFPTAAR